MPPTHAHLHPNPSILPSFLFGIRFSQAHSHFQPGAALSIGYGTSAAFGRHVPNLAGAVACRTRLRFNSHRTPPCPHPTTSHLTPQAYQAMKVIITGEVIFLERKVIHFYPFASNFRIRELNTRDALPGASGVLGSAVRRVFEASQADVLPLSFSRGGNGLIQLDLTQQDGVHKKFEEFGPDCRFDPSHGPIPCSLSRSGVIHCAAERSPDASEQVSRQRLLISS